MSTPVDRAGSRTHSVPRAAWEHGFTFGRLPLTFPAARGLGRSAGLSIVIHGALLVGLVVLPLLSDDTLPEQQSEVRAFLATPLVLAPPPPPPPAPAARTASARPHPSVQPSAFVAPVVTPEALPASPGDLGLDTGGVPGGVEGGVPGGVVGGVVGGLPAIAPPAPTAPMRVGRDVREPRKVKDVPPLYPRVAALAHLQGDVVLDCVIDPSGHVSDVRVVHGIPAFDDAALAAVRQWVYSPTLFNGVPVSVAMSVTVHFRLVTG